MKTKSTVLKSIAVAGALTAAGTVAATTAHADAVNNAAPANAASVSTTNADQQLANLKSQQAANEAQTSSANAAKMSAATSAANGQIANLNNQIKQRQASDVAAHQAKVASATNAINSAAQSATNAENASYSDAVAKQSAANDAALKSAQANIVTEQQKAQQKSQATTEYRKNSADLQKTHNEALTKLASDNQAQTSQINEQIQNVKNDIEKTQNKQSADATAEYNSRVNNAVDAINKAKEVVATDSEQISNKNDVNAKAQKKLNGDNNKLSNEKETLKELENQGTDSIIVTPAFIKGWKDYTQIRKYDNESNYLEKEKYPKIWKEVHDACIQSSALNGEFHANPADEKVPITFDANGVLSRNDIIEATKYAVQLLNPIRKQIGITPLGITNASVDIAAEVAKGYLKDNWDAWTGHDGSLLKGVAKEWGTDFVDEDLASASWFDFDRDSMTLADLKEVVYDSLIMLLFEGQENNNSMGHTTSLLGVRPDWASTDLLGVTYTLGTGSMHFNLIEDGNSQHVKDVRNRLIVRAAGSSTDKTIQGNNYAKIDVPAVSDNAALKAKTESQIKEQQTIVDNDKTAVATSQKDLNSAKSKLSQDEKVLSNKQAELAQLKTNRAKIINGFINDTNNSEAIKNLQSQLNQLNKKLEQQKESYNQAVTNENNIYQGKLNKLIENYNQELDAIKAEPTSLAQLKAELQDKLDTLKKNHEAKLAQIQNDAQKKIAALQNEFNAKDPEIDKLQAKIDAIKDNLAKQQKKLDDQFAALKAKDEADYNALEQKLKNSSSEAAKGHNDHYNTSDGHEVVLPGSDSNQPSSSANTPASSASSDVNSAASSANTPASSATSAANSAASSEAVAPATPASDNNQAVAGNVTSTVADEAVKVSYPAEGVAQAATTSMTREAVKAQAKNDDKSLPQTGNENGIVAMALGTMLAMFGLGVSAKKRY